MQLVLIVPLEGLETGILLGIPASTLPCNRHSLILFTHPLADKPPTSQRKLRPRVVNFFNFRLLHFRFNSMFESSLMFGRHSLFRDASSSPLPGSSQPLYTPTPLYLFFLWLVFLSLHIGLSLLTEQTQKFLFTLSFSPNFLKKHYTSLFSLLHSSFGPQPSYFVYLISSFHSKTFRKVIPDSLNHNNFCFYPSWCLCII